MNKAYELPIFLFHEGRNFCAYDFFGAHYENGEWVFRVWAPKAKEVYVTGDFCEWEKFAHKCKLISDGIFECRIKSAKIMDCYKYVIVTSDKRILMKTDPYAFHFETRPGTAAKLYEKSDFSWNDKKWMLSRSINYDRPLNIYEVHLGTWRTYKDGEYFSYRKIADELIPYVKDMGFSHIELMPITEYPFDGSWGYQVMGYFAPTSRYGSPEDFKYFVDKAHQNNIGIIMDWVPAHFPKDGDGLYEFDGGCLYEYTDNLKKEHELWGTRVFDYGRDEVVSFLSSSACFWLKEYHIDGLRFDAVASMLYLDYGREAWRPNIYGKNENLEAVKFLQDLNTYIHSEFPGVMTIAEESTAWKNVTVDAKYDGLGFDYKWNMGWMNDSLRYISTDPLFRSGQHNTMCFSLSYAFSEKYILPLSHDEVVHGKCSLINKMPGEYEDKFANLRAYISFMYFHPGKKLLFMGSEFGQFVEWRDYQELDWLLLEYENHVEFKEYIKKLNLFYKNNSLLWKYDTDYRGFDWGFVDDYKNNVISFFRKNPEETEINFFIFNFSGCDLKDYKIGVNFLGFYKKIFSSENHVEEKILSKPEKIHNRNYSLVLDLPRFSGQAFKVTKVKYKKGKLK